MRLFYTQISPGHNWTTLYFAYHVTRITQRNILCKKQYTLFGKTKYDSTGKDVLHILEYVALSPSVSSAYYFLTKQMVTAE